MTDRSKERITTLELELKRAPETLQAAFQELESTIERLEAKNEELSRKNRQLRSDSTDCQTNSEKLTDVADASDACELENLRRKISSLSEISQELPDFAYAVSHDLLAPVRHISQYTEILELSVENNQTDRMKKATRVLKTSSRRLRETIDGILAYSRINTLGEALAEIDLLKPVNAAIRQLGPSLEQNNTTVEIDQSMPKALGDERQLELLFYHLIENAIKFRSEADLSIKITAKIAENRIKVSIADNGIGIAERSFDDVFTIFKRLGIKEDAPGAGVGLAICRRIALRHQGEIWLHQVPTGTCVCISFQAA